MSKRPPVLLDTNLLVLLVVGRADVALIDKHKRANIYDVDDFNLLTEFVNRSEGLVICPNVATETSNLIRQIGGPSRETVTDMFGDIVRRADERYITCHEASQHPAFAKLGLTDAAILLLLAGRLQLLTVDLDLYVEAQNAKFRATNFNQLRELKLGY